MNILSSNKRRNFLFISVIIFSLFNFLVSKAENAYDNEHIQKGTKYFEEQKYVDAINNFAKAISEGNENEDPGLSCLAYYNTGVVYFNIYENTEALKNFQKAYEICMVNNLGPIREVEILGGIAGVYFEKKDYKKALELLEKAAKIAEANNDVSMLEYIWENMALISLNTGKFEKTDEYIAKVNNLNKNKEIKNPRILEIEAEKYILTHQYDEAYKTLNSIINDSTITKSGKTYIALMRTLGAQKKYDEAIRIANEYKNDIGILDKSNYYDVLAGIYASTGDLHRSLEMKDSVIFLKDSMEQINTEQLIENNNIMMDVLKDRNESEKRILEAKSQTRMWITLSLVLFLLFVISIMIATFIRYKSKSHQEFLSLQIEKEQNEKKLAQEKMEETEKFAKYRQNVLKKEIERKNKDMEAHLLFINSRTDLLENILKYIEENIEFKGNKYVKKISEHIHSLLNKDNKDKEDIRFNFESADPEFTKRLLEHHPDLLQSDVKFLGFIKMNLTSKEIASLLNIEPDSCKRRRIRLSKKLGLESSTQLYNYLLSLTPQ